MLLIELATQVIDVTSHIQYAPAPLVLPLIGMGVQGVGQLFANSAAAKRRKEEDALIAEKEKNLTALFNKEMATPYFESAEAKDAQEKMKEQMSDVMKGMKSNAISSGATAETQLAAKDDLNENYGDFMSGLAARGTQRRDSLKRNYQNDMNNVFGLKFGQSKESTQSAVNTSANMANIGQAGLIAGQLFGDRKNKIIPDLGTMKSQPFTGFETSREAAYDYLPKRRYYGD